MADDSLPIPVASVTDVFEPLAKKPRINELPCVFLVLVRMGTVASIVGLIRVTALRSYSARPETSSQYCNLIATGSPIDTSKFIDWHVESVLSLTDGPLILPSDANLAMDTRRLNVCKAFTTRGWAMLLKRSVDIGGSSMRLSDFIPSGVQTRCFKLPEETWRQMRWEGLRIVVTALSHMYHAGMSSSDVQPAINLHGPGVVGASSSLSGGASSSQHANFADSHLGDDESSDDDGFDKKHHNFNVIISCMRLSVLLKNASRIKDAISASLDAYNASASSSQAIRRIGDPALSSFLVVWGNNLGTIL